MIRHKICATCKGCCCYEDNYINEYSEEELSRCFCFSRHLSQTFFRFDKKKNKFIMGKYCRHYNNFYCNIYNTDDFPFVCAAYPFFIITKKSWLNRNDKFYLAVDKNCPHWKLFLTQTECINEIIENYLAKDLPIDIFPLNKMRSLGYRLSLLDTELSSIL